MPNAQDLELAIASVRAALKLTGDDSRPEWSTELEPQLEQLRQRYDAEAIGYCLDGFVAAEINFATPGDRGLGRLSSEIPRYGAHFRKHLRRLPAEEVKELAALIRTQILTGYLAFVLPRENPVLNLRTPHSEALFRQWIPNIYSGAIAGTVDDQQRALLITLGADAMSAHLKLLRQKGIEGGGVFAADKSELILFWYHVAGFALRVVQHMMTRDS